MPKKPLVSQEKLRLVFLYTLDYLRPGESANVDVLGTDGKLHSYEFHRKEDPVIIFSDSRFRIEDISIGSPNPKSKTTLETTREPHESVSEPTSTFVNTARPNNRKPPKCDLA